MRLDLLEAIASATDVTNAVVLTHDVDFVFLQTVALAAFRSCGDPTITVFADAHSAADTYARQAPLLDGLGTRYRVVPMLMSPGGRFHPKAVLLSGPKQASMFIGSGNLTFGGWRENAEVWTRFDSAVDGPQPFAELDDYLREVLQQVPLGQSVVAEIDEAFDRNTRTWTGTEVASGPRTLLGRVGVGAALLDAMAHEVVEPPDELVVGVPYFDEDGVALGALLDRLAAPRATVLCQPWRSTLTQRAFTANQARAHLRHVTFHHVDESGVSRRAFLHAKFYAALRGNGATVFSGSANCSIAALSTTGTSGNAELLVVQRMSRADFEASYLAELLDQPDPIVLPDAWPDEDEPLAPALSIAAARLDMGVLVVAFAPSRAVVTECVVDGTSLSAPTLMEAGLLRGGCSGEPRSVQLVGTLDGASVRSAPLWIDHERALRTTAHDRGLGNAIRTHIQAGSWNAGAWAEVMEVFCKHVAYMPDRAGMTSSTHNHGPRDTEAVFSHADVFSSDYSAARPLGGPTLPILVGGKERGLQQMLMRWFGIATDDEAPPLPPGAPEDEGEASRLAVTLVSSTVAGPPPPGAVAKADQRRIEKVLTQVESALTSPKYLGERRPDMLAADLKIAAALLRSALHEQWISASEFFRISHHVWSSLFLDGSPEPNHGWIEYRLHAATDPSGFADAMCSPALAAALLGWAFSVAPKAGSAEAIRFKLAQALAVARLPWLWDAKDRAAVAGELERFARTSGAVDVAAVHDARELMVRRGHALLRFEMAVRGFPLPVLRGRIRRREIAAGDLLWQGSAGYGVAMEHAPRAEKVKVPVLKLQGRVEPTYFAGPFTVPIVDLLDESVMPLSPGFGAAPREEVRTFLAELIAMPPVLAAPA